MSANTLTLKIARDDEVALPAALLDGPLTQSEIGALFILGTVAEGCAGFDHPKMHTEEMKAAIAKFREIGIFNVSVENGKLSISVDAWKALPPEEDEPDAE